MARCMLPRGVPYQIDYEEELHRYQVFFGEAEDSFEIKAAWGFSKSLLYCKTRITYCAGKLHEEPVFSGAVEMMDFLLTDLESMRQSSK